MIEYKVIDGYPDYEIGSDGTVWSKRPWWNAVNIPKRRKLSSPINEDGYKRQWLRDSNGIRKMFFNHVLVLEAFICKRPDGMEACHNNGNKLDNRLENLRWDTPENNCHDKKTHGTENPPMGEEHSKHILKEKDVLEIIFKLKNRARLIDLSKEYGVSPSAISDIKQMRNWKHIKR